MAFWSKDDKVRIDQTVAYIAGQCPAMEQGTIKSFLDKWLASNFGTPTMQGILSSSLSTKGQGAVGNEATRTARRALALLSGDILDLNSPLRLTGAQAMALPQGQVTPRLTALLRPFRIFALQQENVRTLLQMEFNSLMTQPATFLQNNVVIFQSWGTPPGGVRDHQFIYNYAKQHFMMLPSGVNAPPHVGAGVGLTLKAVNVPEIYWAHVPNRGTVATGAQKGSFAGIVSTDLTGADIMVTSAFTGCSFCFKSGAGGTFAAHVSPATAAGDPAIGAPPELAMQIGGPQGTGDFASPPAATAGALQVWGKGYSNVVGAPAAGYSNPTPGLGGSMFVVGTRTAGGWQIHAQENHAASKIVHRLL